MTTASASPPARYTDKRECRAWRRGYSDGSVGRPETFSRKFPGATRDGWKAGRAEYERNRQLTLRPAADDTSSTASSFPWDEWRRP